MPLLALSLALPDGFWRRASPSRPGVFLKKEKVAIDVLNHHLVPKMAVLKEEEKQELLNKYGIDAGMLPRMESNDAAASALGAKKGDIVRIKRKDETGEYDYYRLVV